MGVLVTPITRTNSREMTIAQIADQALAAWQAARHPSVEMAISPVDTAAGGVLGVVWISIGPWDAVLSSGGARRLAREITASWDWSEALPYDPANLAAHLLAMASRAEALSHG